MREGRDIAGEVRVQDRLQLLDFPIRPRTIELSVGVRMIRPLFQQLSYAARRFVRLH